MEEWKDIIEYEGLYQVSNLGNVKNSRTNKLLSLRYRKDNHIDCMLYKNGQGKRYSVHRLVAIAFISNPNNYPIINHIDGNGLNNNVSNLEWCTYSYNTQHANDNNLINHKTGIEHYMFGKTGENHPASEPVYCLNTKERFENMEQAAYSVNLKATDISACCSGKQKSAGLSNEKQRLVWRKEQDYLALSEEEIKQLIDDADIRVVCITTGKIYANASDAFKETGIGKTMILKCCNGQQKKTHNTEWKYYKNYIN